MDPGEYMCASNAKASDQAVVLTFLARGPHGLLSRLAEIELCKAHAVRVARVCQRLPWPARLRCGGRMVVGREGRRV
jgi:hypothetical protein